MNDTANPPSPKHRAKQSMDRFICFVFCSGMFAGGVVVGWDDAVDCCCLNCESGGALVEVCRQLPSVKCYLEE